MDFFLILQVLFDAVLLFGILFLFHFSVHQSQKKREEWDILKNVQVQEIKENLQELLLTLKQLGKEVSDNIQEQVREAEEKTEIFKKTIQKLQKDLNKTLALAEEVNNEKKRLEEKMKIIQTSKKRTAKVAPPSETGETEAKQIDAVKKVTKSSGFYDRDRTVGFSSALVKEVYRLTDESMNVNQIVQETGLSRAEIQLILNLRGNRFTTPN
jgi:DNA repair exonuclease SbcCD ATPase subunit